MPYLILALPILKKILTWDSLDLHIFNKTNTKCYTKLNTCNTSVKTLLKSVFFLRLSRTNIGQYDEKMLNLVILESTLVPISLQFRRYLGINIGISKKYNE